MILSKKDLCHYLKIELGSNYNSISSRLYDYIVPSSKSYIRILRKTEFLLNKKGLWNRLLLIFYKLKLQRLSSATGLSIPVNTCDMGLTIYHHGSIVLNSNCIVGRNCCISNNVNIGATGGSQKAPIIGNNVYIGPGAVIFGDIRIADNCYIGANAVICKSITEENSVVVGVPGRIIKKDPIVWWVKNGLKRD